MKPGRGFVAELRRRNVIRMAGLYLAGTWVVIEVAGTIVPMLGAPDWIGRVLLTVLAIGFIPVLIFAWVFEVTPEGLKREGEIERHESIAPQTGKRMDRAIIVVLLLGLTYLAIDKFVLDPRRDAALVASTRQADADAEKVAAPVPEVDTRSIAVLPLANESGDQNQQYFSDGLSESLITALTQLQGLKVISRNSSFQFRDSHEDSKAIGAKLGVAHLLEGSVRRAGDVVRISATLVKVADGSTQWSQQYDRPFKDVFALQDEITQAVSTALKTRLLAGSAGRQSDRPPNGSVAAYEAMLQGNFQYANSTQADTREAVAYFEQAVKLDPAYAHAWARLAVAYVALGINYTPSPEERSRLVREARMAAATALRLDGDLAVVQVTRGWLEELLDLDLAAAAVAYRRAAELAPQNITAALLLAGVEGKRDRPEQALAMARRAIALDPLSNIARFRVGLHLLTLKRYPEAEQEFRKVVEQQPQGDQNRMQLALAQMLQGRSADAVATARREPDPFWRAWALALTQWSNGDHAASNAALNILLAENADDSGSQIAAIYAQRGQPDLVFHWLEHARKTGDPGVLEIYMSPFLVRYRDDPRFAAFCREVGLPAPGEATR